MEKSGNSAACRSPTSRATCRRTTSPFGTRSGCSTTTSHGSTPSTRTTSRSSSSTSPIRVSRIMCSRPGSGCARTGCQASSSTTRKPPGVPTAASRTRRIPPPTPTARCSNSAARALATRPSSTNATSAKAMRPASTSPPASSTSSGCGRIPRTSNPRWRRGSACAGTRTAVSSATTPTANRSATWTPINAGPCSPRSG